MAQRVTGSLQFPCVATAVITPATAKGDWSVVRKLLTIPEDALLLWGYVHVITAFDDSTSLTIDVGDDDDPDRFTETAPVDLASTGVTACNSTNTNGVMYNDTAEVQATFVAGAGDASVGKAVVYLAYLRPDSAHGVG